MAEKSIEEKVKDIIVEQLGVNPEQVTPQASFIEDLGADSLDIVELVMAYLRSNFELKNKAGRPVALSWNGIEGQPDMFWIFVKGRAPGGLEGAQLRNKIFCELFDDQVNIVNAKHQGKQIGLMFEAKDDFKILR